MYAKGSIRTAVPSAAARGSTNIPTRIFEKHGHTPRALFRKTRRCRRGACSPARRELASQETTRTVSCGLSLFFPLSVPLLPNLMRALSLHKYSRVLLPCSNREFLRDVSPTEERLIWEDCWDARSFYCGLAAWTRTRATYCC